MKKYIKNNAKHATAEYRHIPGRWVDRYFYSFCDICGARSGEIPVDELCEEEGFPDGDYCWNCQMSMREQGFVGKDESVYFLRKTRIDEETIEENDIKATQFVCHILQKTKEFSKHSDPIKVLDFAGYSKKGKLVGYEDFEEYLDSLNKKQLRLFFKLFINRVHQASYELL